MANYKRKRSRKNPRCAICTPNRMGNAKNNGTKGKVNRDIAKRNKDNYDIEE